MEGRNREAGHEQSDSHFSRERNRRVEQQYADILTTLGGAAAKAGTPNAGAVLMEAGKNMRRLAAGLPLDTAPLTRVNAALYRLTYVSFAVERDPAHLLEQASAIARVSARRNRSDELTGALSVGSGWFAQVLEGPANPLMACFDRVLSDPRHKDVRVLDFGPIDTRQFAYWSMAFSGEVAPELVRQAVTDYARQESFARGRASASAFCLAAAMATRLGPFAAAAE